ncbi:MAG: Superoxide dismutase [Pseudomonadota bacterium]|jgi:Fe-Mn family superoxide dismutase
MIFSSESNQTNSPFILPELPYDKGELAPYLTIENFEYHHEKHHNAYVINLNKLLENHELKGKTLEEIILASAGKSEMVGIFNNAAQIWNHTFYWHSMRKNGGGTPSGKILKKIEEDFGSFDNFANEFKQAGATQFGSGWAWLVSDGGKLKVIKTSNAATPITDGLKPLITCDVWEHAYYIDYRNRRPDYIAVFLEHLVNWEFAEKNLG